MSDPQELLRQAADQATTPFDYIVVGAGAGGGPLASRLALAGKTVLVVDSGGDPAEAPPSPRYPHSTPGQVHDVPAYYAAASEDPEMSWMYSVRHYEDTARQQRDEKYNRNVDPNTGGALADRFLDQPQRPGGIFYPRSSGLGGCTAHHAMIIVAPNDKDWNGIADLTGDASWRASQMRGYFAKLEYCLYVSSWTKVVSKILGVFYRVWRWLVLQFDPRAVLDDGGHGRSGWQPTNFIDPFLVETIKKEDRGFVRLLIRSALAVLHGNSTLIATLAQALVRLRIVQRIDFNDVNTRRLSPEGVYLIPIGTGSPDIADEKGGSSKGTRFGVREFLLKTQNTRPRNIVIRPKFHVTRLLFEQVASAETPRAIGIEGVAGASLYAASPQYQKATTSTPERLFAKHEILLCSGAFNSPQLLMLSGIGDVEALQKLGVEGLAGADGRPLSNNTPSFIHLPGVGANLQDRYEVTVVSELDHELETLQSASFEPGDPNDRALAEWNQSREGLYTTNGGTLAVIRRSEPARKKGVEEPDIFAFGAPAAFRGYYWNWSRELFLPTLGAQKEVRKLWTWVILKAYTDNNAGYVKLRSRDPFDTPEICFRSFDECHAPGWRDDLDAVVDTIAFMRKINARNPRQFVNEIQPGKRIQDYTPAMADWVMDQAWGHHACGTCRIGSDAWQADALNLKDVGAVVDSRFRVHGVSGLRIVDASVFPRIPGYFIVTPVFMISEKAADTILQDLDHAAYPQALRGAEEEVVRQRRARAEQRADQPTTGLALSGGGIRSSTFSLGLLQALSQKGRLREIDFLSTVSGGGFIGSFLGRLFTRQAVQKAADPVGRVQEFLKDGGSAPLAWLRAQANYLTGAGASDVRQILATYWRNAMAVYLVMGTLAFALFGLAVGVGHAIAAPIPQTIGTLKLSLSPWGWLPAALFLFAVTPVSLGYWLVPTAGSTRDYSTFGLIAFIASLAVSSVVAVLPGGFIIGSLAVTAVLLGWLWQEILRPHHDDQAASVTRNRMTRTLGSLLQFFVLSLLWWVLDSLAMTAKLWSGYFMAAAAVATPTLPMLKGIAERLLKQPRGQSGSSVPTTVFCVCAFGVALLLLLVIDIGVHLLFDQGDGIGWISVALAFVFSASIGRARAFLNLSSLHRTYESRLKRSFLGASNEARIYDGADNQARNIQLDHPGDDIPFQQYNPEVQGGPLHLINVCVNESVDVASERDVGERKGLSMCVGPLGVSVSRRYHALWKTPPDVKLSWKKALWLWIQGLDETRSNGEALQPIATTASPSAFHVFGRKDGQDALVEPLSLGAWTAISGAAFSTGAGRSTTDAKALLFGLINLRLGYWWDSGIGASQRPGRYPPSITHRFLGLPRTLFAMQSELLDEWRGLFGGPSRRFWNLSDGGHFENTGLYELIRRRLDFMIAVDGGADPSYHREDLANLMRLVRVDFDAEINWLNPAPNAASEAGWSAFTSALPAGVASIPAWVTARVDPDSLGPIDGIRNGAKQHAALGLVRYGASSDRPTYGWILLFKPATGAVDSLDVQSYGLTNAEFPQQSTVDQIYDDAQWESYRALGQQIGLRVLI